MNRMFHQSTVTLLYLAHQEGPKSRDIEHETLLRGV